MSSLRLLKQFVKTVSSSFLVLKHSKNKKFVSLFCFLVFLTIRHYIIKWYRKYKKYPPGPIGLPIIGSLLTMLQVRKFTRQLPFKYGPIMYTTIGERHFILINDSKLFKKIAKTKEFINRPIGLASNTIKTTGLTFLSGNYWNERSLNIKKSLLNIVSKTEYLENGILKVLNSNTYNILNDSAQNNKLFYGNDTFRHIVFSNLFFTSFGVTSDCNDPLYNKYIKLSNKWLPRMFIGFLPFYLGFLKYFVKSYIKNTIKIEIELHKIVKQMIDRMNKSKINYSFVSNMFDKNNKVYNKLPLDNKISDIVEMFVAASDTTTNVLTTSFVLLSMNISVQNEVRSELVNVFKDNNYNFTLRKIKECPKLEALCYECIRLSNIGYMPTPHVIFKEMKIKVKNKEYVIPKNSLIVENLTFIHDLSPYENWIPIKRNSKYDFNHTLILDNFLEKDKKTNKLKFKINESFVYFGFGRRDCIGKQLAIKQLQFIIGQLLLNYKFSLPNNQKIEQLKFIDGFVNRAEPIGLVLKRV